MRLIDANVVMETLGIKSDCVNCDYADEIFFCTKGKNFVDACEAIQDAPTIETKQIKYFDEEEKVWKVGSVIVNE